MEDWTDRRRVERSMPSGAKHYGDLNYDPDYGIYLSKEGEPFSGMTVARYPDGELESVVQYSGGLAWGVAVVWYASGQIELYREMAGGVVHEREVFWNADGSVRSDRHLVRGRIQRGEPDATQDPPGRWQARPPTAAYR